MTTYVWSFKEIDMNHLFNEKSRNTAQHALDRLVSVATASGIPFGFQANVAVRHLSYLASPHLSDDCVLIVVRHMVERHKSRLVDFEKLYDRHIRRQNAHQARKRRKWTFLIPINTVLPTNGALRLSILGIVFRLMRCDQAIRLVGTRRAGKIEPFLKLKQHPVTSRIQTCIVVDGHGSNHVNAWYDEIDSAFDALRGVFEISHSFSRVGFRLGKQRRRAKIPMPPWAFAFSLRQPWELIPFLAGVPINNEPLELIRERLKPIRIWASILRRPVHPRSSIALLVDALRLYAQAFDAEADFQCCLGLWQLAESLTLASAYQGEGTRVARRLSWFGQYFSLDPTALNHILLGVFSKRNDIVHAGLQRANETDINVLKLCCEAAMDWILTHRSRISTREHLEEFYERIRRSDAELQTTANVTRVVQSFKKKVAPQLTVHLNNPISGYGTWNATAGYELKQKAKSALNVAAALQKALAGLGSAPATSPAVAAQSQTSAVIMTSMPERPIPPA